MPLLPYARWTLQSPLTPEEVRRRLSGVVEPPRLFRLPFTRGPLSFQGETQLAGFKLWRIISYRNSFLPIIVGTVAAAPRGSVISITFRLHRLVLGFLAVWCGLPVLASLSALADGMTRGELSLLAFAPVPLCIVALGYGLTMAGFLWELPKAQEWLQSTVEGTPISP